MDILGNTQVKKKITKKKRITLTAPYKTITFIFGVRTLTSLFHWHFLHSVQLNLYLDILNF